MHPDTQETKESSSKNDKNAKIHTTEIQIFAELVII